MIVPCKTIEEMLKRALAYPRRVEPMEDDLSVGFKADDGTRFYITRIDFEASTKDSPYRTQCYLRAIETEKGKQDYCESINYGKPDWKSDDAPQS